MIRWAISVAGRCMAAGSICTPRVCPPSATRTKMVLSGVAAVYDCSVKADRRCVDRLLVAEFRCDGPQLVGGGAVRGFVIGERRRASRHHLVGRRLALMHDRPVGPDRREDLGFGAPRGRDLVCHALVPRRHLVQQCRGDANRCHGTSWRPPAGRVCAGPRLGTSGSSGGGGAERRSSSVSSLSSSACVSRLSESSVVSSLGDSVPVSSAGPPCSPLPSSSPDAKPA